MNRLTKSDKSRQRIAAVGMWDGVHAGHRFLIDYMKVEAAYTGLTPSVITFDSHPLSVVRPLEAPLLINTFEQRMENLEKAGVQDCILLDFNEKVRRMSAKDFLKMLRKDYNVCKLVVGFNNRFGHDRVDGIEQYRKIASELDMEIIAAPEYKGEGAPISSSGIRQLINEGRMKEVSSRLGYHFTMHGMVVDGNKVGRTIGFPTANIRVNETSIIPVSGVYAAWVTTPDGIRRKAMVNIGFRPTVTSSDSKIEMSIEVHILNFVGYLYGEELKLEIVDRLRAEKKFSSLRRLRSRLESDAKQAEAILKD